MNSRLISTLWLLLLGEFIFFSLCKSYPMEFETLSTEVGGSFSLKAIEELPELWDQSHSDENKLRRRRRSSSAEEENSGERGPVEDIEAIKQIVDLLRSVGQKVIPIVMQGASVLNGLLSNLGTS